MTNPIPLPSRFYDRDGNLVFKRTDIDVEEVFDD